jgi:hypothetical protein
MSADEQVPNIAPKPGQPPQPAASTPTGSATGAMAAGGEAKPASQLTPEEQMALFEKELKENDWGHQPC